MRNRTRHYGIFGNGTTPSLILAIVFSMWGWASSAADAGRTCGLVVEASKTLEDSPLVALLEAGLLESGMVMVERMMIDQALAEQELAAALGPAAVAERVNLGQVLNADVLVFVKADAGKPGDARSPAVPLARLIVCDAASGVRTLVRDIPLDVKELSKAKEWATHVVAAASATDQARELCAVPPFVSKDLAFEYDAMKTACAAVVEQAVARHPDLCGVELAEAQALERELQLADKDDATVEKKVLRSLPFYLLGEYRNGGLGADRVVSIKLTLREGDHDLGTESVSDLEPDRVGPAIVELVDKLLDGRKRGAKPTAIDTEAETKQLMQRAGDFARLGDWLEAIKLYEACLLLDPGHKQARAKVMEAISRLPETDIRGLTLDQCLAAMQEEHQLARRGFRHMEQYCRRFSIEPQDVMVVSFETANLPHGHHRDSRSKDVFRETKRLNREILLSLIESRVKDVPEDSLLLLIARQNLALQLDNESADEGFDRLFEILLQIKDRPDAQELARSFCTQHYPIVGFGPHGQQLYASAEQWQPFVDRVEATGIEALRAGVRKSRNSRMSADRANAKSYESAMKREAEQAAAKPKQVDIDDATVVLERVDVRPVIGTNRTMRSPPSIRGWCPAGRGVELLWSGDDLFLLKQEGVAKSVWWSGYSDVVAKMAHIESPVYDGRFVWAAWQDEKNARLIVLDPVTEKTWEIGKADGLLPMNGSVFLGAVGPGKICVVSSLTPPGSIGVTTRGWCALATFDPSTGPAIEVFHEASEVLQGDPAIKVAPPTIGFSPTHFGVIGPAGPDRRLIVGRRTDSSGSLTHSAFRGAVPALIVNPEKRTVELWGAKSRLPGKAGAGWFAVAAEHGNDLYFFEIGDQNRPDGWQADLFRVSGPDANVSLIGKRPPINPKKEYQNINATASFDGTIYMLGESLWAIDPKTGTVTTIKYAFPDRTVHLQKLAVSERYGLVTWRNEPIDRTAAPSAQLFSVQGFYRFPLPAKGRPNEPPPGVGGGTIDSFTPARSQVPTP